MIEDAREPGYISEKLIDAFLCRTVPIYWGAPDIAEWFDPAGMILVDGEADILSAVQGLGARDHDEFASALEANRDRALRLSQGKRRAVELLSAEIA